MMFECIAVLTIVACVLGNLGMLPMAGSLLLSALTERHRFDRLCCLWGGLLLLLIDALGVCVTVLIAQQAFGE